MADYSIKSGDCLWNIVKSNYDVKSNKEINEIIDLISKENELENPGLIYAGSNLVLPETDSFIRTTQDTEDVQDETQDATEKTKADELQEWNSYDNAIKYSNGEEIEEFQMFDALGENMSDKEYFAALQSFSQSFIDKYDSNDDGLMDETEFEMMATDELGVEEYAKQITQKEVDFMKSMNGNQFEIPEDLINESITQTAQMLPEQNKTLFAAMQFDDDATTISSSEFAAQFLYADMNENGNVDGKINFLNYNTFTDLSKEDREYNYSTVEYFAE